MPATRSWSRNLWAKSIPLSIWVAIPTIIALTALASSFLTFELIMRILDAAGVTLPPGGRQHLYDAGAQRILGMALAGVLIGTVLSYALMGPIRVFRKGAMEVARGNLARAMDIGRDLGGMDEIAGIGTAFNDMLQYMNRYIVESMSGGVMTIDVTGRVTSFNAAAEIIFGYDASDVLGRPVFSLFPNVRGNQAFLDHLRAAIERKSCVSSEEVNVELRDGRRLAIGVTLSHLTDGTSTILGLVLTFKDLAEIKRVREQVRQSEQLAALGSLAAGVAHELRNPLGSLQIMAASLEEGLSDGDPKRDVTARISATIDRLDRLVADLLTFAHPGDQSLEWTDLVELL
ncbi:MAG: PAS domain-containing protein, partial [Myxococcales bacterium]|nr:PAS domain-containing protein [Myxococcales bacterium]